ncbi:metal-dependent transcriptional regulator [Winogradskyella undariae]|uniref:metal-dependent transcriptional regulator n=1 Tax=Winogradskyella TaxID=286104 RepID=UPI00156B1839|nr:MULTISPECIES: metal-dependent transcriptional regulator [Winogradskyella]NRR91583.1 metal-dependent transcriptional regulator [Winogradskyella undariae]QXP80698.1 metal-dependent transcriptional regulator [Winogradskyella sp. HaHa_3_26]
MTLAEENYLKAIYHLEQQFKKGVSTNALAEEMNTKASSATDMVKKLAEKKMVTHVPYQGATLSKAGRDYAVKVIRRHRLWEVFLVEKLNFSWDEVHEVAEHLEHINSDKLVNELDAFLEFPIYDPHGDPIPDKDGNFKTVEKIILAKAEIGFTYKCIGVDDTSSEFLKYLDSNSIGLGTIIKILHKEPFDNSIKLEIEDSEIVVSQSVAKNLYLKKV